MSLMPIPCPPAAPPNAYNTLACSPAMAGLVSIRAENRRLQKAVVHDPTHTKGLSAGNIRAVARSGVVTLLSSVSDAAQVELTVTATRRVDGVKDLKESLLVRPAGGARVRWHRDHSCSCCNNRSGPRARKILE